MNLAKSYSLSSGLCYNMVLVWLWSIQRCYFSGGSNLSFELRLFLNLKCKWTKPTFCRIGEKALCIAIRPKRDAAHGFGNFWRDRTGYWRGRRRVYGFPMDLVDYVKRTWVNGKFSVQDWNIFDVGKLSTKILHRIIISKSCPKFCKFGDNFFLFWRNLKNDDSFIWIITDNGEYVFCMKYNVHLRQAIWNLTTAGIL